MTMSEKLRRIKHLRKAMLKAHHPDFQDMWLRKIKKLLKEPTDGS
jgi:hypothetical protein